jgi:DNA-binding SARP family transcriptional activator
MTTGMEFGLLGTVLVRVDGTIVEIQQGKLRVVLAALLLDVGKVVTTERLIDALWGNAPPPTARATTATYVNRLRDKLGDNGRALITTCLPGYVIHVTDSQLDVSRFKANATAAQAAARRGSWEEAQALADAALELWRGEPLADVDSELLREREVPFLAELRMQALQTRLDADLHLGFHSRAAAELYKLTAAYPEREQLHARLMLALYLSDRQAEALAAYRHARRLLIEQFGTEPGPALDDLHQKILTADPALAALFPQQADKPHQRVPRNARGRHERVPPGWVSPAVRASGTYPAEERRATDDPGAEMAAPTATIRSGHAGRRRAWVARVSAAAVFSAVLALIGYGVLAHASDSHGSKGPGGEAAADPRSSCVFMVNANDINIRVGPFGDPSGYMLDDGDQFVARSISSGTSAGQYWIDGYSARDPSQSGWVGQKYLLKLGTGTCPFRIPGDPSASATASAVSRVPHSSCVFIANANNINIRVGPDGDPSGYVLDDGDQFVARSISSGTSAGQYWIDGYSARDPSQSGWVGQKYLQEPGASRCPFTVP